MQEVSQSLASCGPRSVTGKEKVTPTPCLSPALLELILQQVEPEGVWLFWGGRSTQHHSTLHGVKFSHRDTTKKRGLVARGNPGLRRMLSDK